MTPAGLGEGLLDTRGLDASVTGALEILQPGKADKINWLIYNTKWIYLFIYLSATSSLQITGIVSEAAESRKPGEGIRQSQTARDK